MATLLPPGYSVLPGIPTAPPPPGYNYAPGLDGKWYSFPTGQDNTPLYNLPNLSNQTSGFMNIIPSLPQLPSLSQILDAGLQGILHPLDTFTNPSAAAASVAAGNGPIQSATATAGSFFDFIGNIPRVATLVVGALFIAAGLFSLAGGRTIHIVNLVRPTKE